MLFKFGLAETPLCYFCNEELETLEHFLFHCEKLNTFWNELNTILKSEDLVSTNFDIKDILFGHSCSDEDDGILSFKINHLDQPFICKMPKKTKKTYQIERFIVNKK